MPNRKAIDELAEAVGVPYAWGSHVLVDGFSGIVVAARGTSRLGVILVEDATESVRWFHPNDGSVVLSPVKLETKLREYWVKPHWVEWNDIDNLIIVVASGHMKARYKGWAIINEWGYVTRADLLTMLARRKYSSDDRKRWARQDSLRADAKEEKDVEDVWK